MCLLCFDYQKLSLKDLVKNAKELSETNPLHAEEFFYKLESEDPDLMDKVEEEFWLKLKDIEFQDLKEFDLE